MKLWAAPVEGVHGTGRRRMNQAFQLHRTHGFHTHGSRGYPYPAQSTLRERHNVPGVDGEGLGHAQDLFRIRPLVPVSSNIEIFGVSD